MSGFKEDVIAILRDNLMLHSDSIGYIVGARFDDDPMLLYREISAMGFVVAKQRTKLVLRYDYVVIPLDWSVETLLYSLSVLNENGIIIFQILDDNLFDEKYVSLFGKFTAYKLRTTNDNTFMIIKAGVDYGY